MPKTQETIQNQVLDKFPAKELEVDINHLRKNPWNPNIQSEFIYKKELESIKTFGFVSPILVREVEEVDIQSETKKLVRYQIIDGEHRWRGCVELGFQTIKVWNLGPIEENVAKMLTLIMNNTRGKDDVVKRGELLNQLSEGQLQLLPFTEQDINFEKELINWDFSKFDKVEIPEKQKDPMKEAYYHLYRASIIFEEHYEELPEDLKGLTLQFSSFVENFKKIVEKDGK